mgnify:CR=1 FL=1
MRVAHRVAAHAHRHIVAAMLAFRANAFRDPPDRPGGRTAAFRRSSAAGSPRSRAAGCARLVREDRFDLRRRQRRDGGDRQQNHGTHPADDRWHFDGDRLYDVNGGGQSRSRCDSRRQADCQRDAVVARAARCSVRACHQPPAMRASNSATPIIHANARPVTMRPRSSEENGGTEVARANWDARSRRTARLNRLRQGFGGRDPGAPRRSGCWSTRR